MASSTSSMASRTSSRDWVIQMTRNCCGSQTSSQQTQSQISSQETQSQTPSQPTHSQTQSQPTPNENGEIRVSWIKSKLTQEVRGAWDHVLRKTPEADQAALRSKYKYAVKAVEVEARAIYKNGYFNPVTRDTDVFVGTMIDQGCFTLLVALRSLSGSDHLGLSWSKQNIRTWMLDLFGISNQIPLVVLKELMKQKFFKDTMESVMKKRESQKKKRPNDLPRRVFYDHLVESKTNSPGSQVNLMKRLLSSVSSRGLSHQESSPPTLLHALWVLLTGPASGGARFLSLITSRGGLNSHQEPSPPTLFHALWGLVTGPASGGAEDNSARSVDDNNCAGANDNSLNVGDDDDDENDSAWSTVRSATELQKEKIIFKSNKGRGTRGIEFQKNMFDAYVYLPSITIEDDTVKLFKHLIDYEEDIGFNRKQREVCAYLKLMSELVRNPDDAKILAMQGIINAVPDQELTLPKMLQGLPLSEARNSQKLQDVRDEIRSYVKPSKWERLRDLIVITLLLTLVQTIYTAVGYHFPNK